MKRGRWKEGNVVEIALPNGTFCYARVIKFPLMAFYDVNSKTPQAAEAVLGAKVLFRIFVMRRWDKNWRVIGNAPLEPPMQVYPVFFRQDIFTGKFTKYLEDGTEIPSTFRECRHVECAAVWDTMHVDDRLRDHFDGVPNDGVESLKLERVSRWKN